MAYNSCKFVLDSRVMIQLPATARNAKYVDKDNRKANLCTKFIGRGSSKSSTESYRKYFSSQTDIPVNSQEYSENDIVFISAEGNRVNRIKPDFELIRKAADSSVVFLTDIPYHRNREYNIGEREVAEFLLSNGYTEYADGIWSKLS